MKKEDIETLKKAGTISVEIVAYAKTLIKPEVLLLEIAEKIESKIKELGAKPAFPINLSVDEIAAHATPAFNDEETAHGLLKVDIGCHIDGLVADTAFSVNLAKNTDEKEENQNLIDAAESALKKGQEIISFGVEVREIGKAIETELKSQKVQPVVNLSGHSIEPWDLHAGITIPNVDNHQPINIEEGVYAIEPFTTTGLGAVRDGKPSGIYHLKADGTVRDTFAREVLKFIAEEYQTLPFCSRWIHKKFGSRGLLALRQIEQAGLLHHYAQLIEKSGAKVAQAENTVIITEKETITITE